VQFSKEVTMFDLTNFKYTDTLLLNITNGVLGVASVGLVISVCWSAVHEFILRQRELHQHH
jgi:hypothetical protein